MHAAAINEAVVDAARAHAMAARGEQTAIVQRLAAQLCVSSATAYERLRKAGALVSTGRKKRSDAGALSLSRDEAVRIAALIEETRRETGTGQLSLERSVQILRGAGLITAGRIDPETGEYAPLSVSAINRALRHYNLHPGQLAEPTPAMRLSSPHPNWCWQIDASVSRQFYLADDGTRVMPEREYYRGKPGNLVKINDQRLWRYAVTDHAAGYIEPFYVQGAESAANLLATLIYVMTVRESGCMHGVPRYLMSDPGSAVTAAATRNFLRAFATEDRPNGIELIVNGVGNARAKGQVENANYIIETQFEAALKLMAPVTSVAEINKLAARWARAYNATQIHSRTGMTRRDGWLRITPEQLLLAPSVEVLRALPHSTAKTCTVRDYQIKFKGERYSLREMAGVLNGQRVDVVINPFDERSVRVLCTGADGRPAQFFAPLVERDSWGFDLSANQIGTRHAALPQTPADVARSEIERVAMDSRTNEAAAANRKAKRLAFAGAIDPMAHLGDTKVVPHLPRAGRQSGVQAPEVLAPQSEIPTIRPVFEAPRLSVYETARELKARVEDRGGTWTAELYARVSERWPEGVTEDQLDAAAVQLMAPVLRAVVGGAA